MPTLNPLLKYLPEFRTKRIAVIGDVMLDVFMRGNAERISPEAPVPVVAHTTTTSHLGGAGNTANNIAALGASVMLLGIVGRDREAREVTRLARAAKIKPLFVTDLARLTTTKTRIAARHHQFVRLDQETRGAIPRATEKKLIALIESMPKPDIVVVSDYAKGVITPDVMKALKKKVGGARILGDFRPQHASLFRHVRAITPNTTEAGALTGISVNDDKSASQAALFAAERFDTSVVLTRGEQGMTIYEKGKGRPVHVKSEAREVFDVTGAGDSVIAVVALMLASGADLKSAALAANFVAGIIVGREGTAAVSAGELQTLFRS